MSTQTDTLSPAPTGKVARCVTDVRMGSPCVFVSDSDDTISAAVRTLSDAVKILSAARQPVVTGQPASVMFSTEAANNERSHTFHEFTNRAGDLPDSLKCDCGPQRRADLGRTGSEGASLRRYRNQEGRGNGLANMIRVYVHQEKYLDTGNADHRSALEDDDAFARAANAQKHGGVL